MSSIHFFSVQLIRIVQVHRQYVSELKVCNSLYKHDLQMKLPYLNDTSCISSNEACNDVVLKYTLLWNGI